MSTLDYFKLPPVAFVAAYFAFCVVAACIATYIAEKMGPKK